MNKLIERITNQESFQIFYSSILSLSVRTQIKSLEFYDQKINIDWDFMLRVADLQSISNSNELLDIALRISQTCLNSEECTESQKEKAIFILKKTANAPAISLARKRGLLPKFVDNVKSVNESIADFKISWKNKIIDASGNELNINSFQNDFWEEVFQSEILSVSAPTAAGKSFIFCKYIAYLLNTGAAKNIIYIVPTRALIGQVEADLNSELVEQSIDANIVTLPKQENNKESQRNIFVFTQERLHFYLATENSPGFDIVFIDEAHKLTDSYRGILLQHAILKISEINTKVVYASPFSKNPEVLLDLHPRSERKKSIYSSVATVNQNLFWVNQKPRTPARWEVTQVARDIKAIGELKLTNTPNTNIKRLTNIAYEIGKDTYGNIVYVNTPSDAEKAAWLIAEQLRDNTKKDRLEYHELRDLIELCQKTIHKKFLLIKCLEHGVAFHYGNIPQLIRAKIEDLFKKNILTYLVCTSTLVEGVNMSCKNIFLRGPRKGRAKINSMSEDDFWNLAGRAGRWGKEFQGNIYCIDTSDSNQWPNGAPRFRQPYRLSTSVEKHLEKPAQILTYLENKTPRTEFLENITNEYLISYLCEAYLKEGKISYELFSVPEKTLKELNYQIGLIFSQVEVPTEIIVRNPGISPYAMQGLLAYFRTKGEADIESAIPAHAASEDTVESYTKVFSRINKYLAPRTFGFNSKRVFMLALLVTRWMNGYSLSRLISDREKRSDEKIATVIRSVLDDVENVARFLAPKYISCYVDILALYLSEINKESLLDHVKNIQISLEFGVSTETHISLISLGLSRTSAIELSSFMPNSDLSRSECIDWIKDKDISAFELPNLVLYEISELKDSL